MPIRIRDFLEPGSGMEKSRSGIRNKHPGSAIMQKTVEIVSEVKYFDHFLFAGNTRAPDPLAAKRAASILCRWRECANTWASATTATSPAPFTTSHVTWTIPGSIPRSVMRSLVHAYRKCHVAVTWTIPWLISGSHRLWTRALVPCCDISCSFYDKSRDLDNPWIDP
jgi:hypothetical protein